MDLAARQLAERAAAIYSERGLETMALFQEKTGHYDRALEYFRMPVERYEQVGNAAGAGARQLLLSARRCEAAVSLSRRVTYVELTVHPEFTKCFLSELRLA